MAEQWPPKGFKWCPDCDGNGFPKGKPEQSCKTCSGTCIVSATGSRN